MLTDNSQKTKFYITLKIWKDTVVTHDKRNVLKTKMSYIFYQIGKYEIFDNTMLLV